MMISCIVATDENLAIGKDNDIPWYLPADLQYFKKQTINKCIVMGRKCFTSIGRPLPKRENIIITRDPYYAVSNALVVHSISEAIALASDNGHDECCIIGGGMIYEQTQDLWQKLYLTRVHTQVAEAEVYFPKLDWSEWNLIESTKHEKDEKNEVDYSFEVYLRK